MIVAVGGQGQNRTADRGIFQVAGSIGAEDVTVGQATGHGDRIRHPRGREVVIQTYRRGCMRHERPELPVKPGRCTGSVPENITCELLKRIPYPRCFRID